MFNPFKRKKVIPEPTEKIKTPINANMKVGILIFTNILSFMAGMNSGKAKNKSIIDTFQKIFDNLVDNAEPEDRTETPKNGAEHNGEYTAEDI